MHRLVFKQNHNQCSSLSTIKPIVFETVTKNLFFRGGAEMINRKMSCLLNMFNKILNNLQKFVKTN